MYDMDVIDGKLRELTSEQLRNLYKFLKHIEEDGYLYVGRDERNKLFLTKKRVIYDSWRQGWETVDEDLVFEYEQISRFVEDSLFGHVPIEFEDEEQVMTCELTIEIERINKERGCEVIGGNEKLNRAIELMDEFTLTMHNIINKYDEVVKKEIL